MIKIVLFDVDGVITDGKVSVDQDGNERKQVDFKDIDAVFELKRLGYKVGLITGEATGMARFFERRFEPDYFYCGCKDKMRAIQEILDATGFALEEVCYVGDGKYDIAPIGAVGLGVCPANAIQEARDIAKLCLSNRGGDGCVWELKVRLEEMKKLGALEFRMVQGNRK